MKMCFYFLFRFVASRHAPAGAVCRTHPAVLLIVCGLQMSQGSYAQSDLLSLSTRSASAGISFPTTFFSEQQGMLAEVQDWKEGSVNYLDPANPGQGYWKLRTNFAARATIINLYRADHELIYREIIPGQYIKLTERTICRINETLALVASNRLLLSKVKAYDLTEETRGPQPTESVSSPAPTIADKEYAGIQVDARVLVNPNKVLVLCDNPTETSLGVYLRNKNGQILYQEFMHQAKYARKVDMSGMKPGTYFLQIRAANLKFQSTRQIVVHGNNSIEIQ